MAKPRVFVSSTYFDLKHIRSSLDLFIDTLGFESILSEKGDIAYSPDIPLDESCYREVENIDIFVLTIGGRYGSETSSEEKKLSKSFYDRYESITKKEYESALNNDTPCYILIETNVYAEYKTFLRNKDNKNINYAHVDSINIFHFIEEILSKPRNNPIYNFEKFSQIAEWLKVQWAGLFRELLKRKSQQSQIKNLTTEVTGLQEVNKTLKTYLEAMMSGVTKVESNKLIEKEEKRLKDFDLRKIIEKNRFFRYVSSRGEIDVNEYITVLAKAKNFEDFIVRLKPLIKEETTLTRIREILLEDEVAKSDLNEGRAILGLSILENTPVNRE